MKPVIIYTVIAVFLFLNACNSLKTTPETARENLEKIDRKDFAVKANFANPLRMQQVVLTSEYDLRIKNDSAFAFLPYYGVAHTAPMNPAEGGIKFAELMIDYRSKSTRKNDGREINFKVNAGEYNYVINMTVYQNGTATFVVNSYQRDAITFHGEMK